MSAPEPAERPSWLKRAAWFVALWLAGVLAVAALAYGLRAAIPGM